MNKLPAVPLPPESLVEIPFTKTRAGKSWYRHESWRPGLYKRFQHCHTMSHNIVGFTFYNEKAAAR